jgi:hypothetical protein
MWGALLATSLARWLHQLIAISLTTDQDDADVAPPQSRLAHGAARGIGSEDSATVPMTWMFRPSLKGFVHLRSLIGGWNRAGRRQPDRWSLVHHYRSTGSKNVIQGREGEETTE